MHFIWDIDANTIEVERATISGVTCTMVYRGLITVYFAPETFGSPGDQAGNMRIEAMHETSFGHYARMPVRENQYVNSDGSGVYEFGSQGKNMMFYVTHDY